MSTTTVAAVILLVAGIGEAAVRASGAQAGASPKAAPAAFNACTLLTTQEASAAVGQAVGDPKSMNPPQSSMPGVTVAACEYESASRDSVHVTVWRPFGDSAQMFLQIYKSECLKKEQVPGLGDIACWNSKEHRELQVLKGTTIMTIELRRTGSASEALLTVTKKAAARLP